jgi:adenylate kinase family enzyme
MRPVIPPRFVSLIGLPGSGKTTLCRSLAQALGWHAFVIGDALRARAASDPALQQMLDHGELAPEDIAVQLMREAARRAAGKGFLVDGFPRHRNQVDLAKEVFSPWTILYLKMPSSVAELRLGRRLFCLSCNWVGTNENLLSGACPQCGDPNMKHRPEDEPQIVSKRIKEAEARLTDLITVLPADKLISVDATKSPDHVHCQAAAALAVNSSDQDQ